MFLGLKAGAQSNYTLQFSDNIRGNVAMAGNTSLHIKSFSWLKGYYVDTLKMNDTHKNGNSTFGNDHSVMAYVDVDGDAATFNSSAAALALPEGTNKIRMARLYWGGRNAEMTHEQIAAFGVRIKGSAGQYTSLTAARVDKIGTQYQASADVTEFIHSHGAGEYTVANIPISTGDAGEPGNFGGWALVVVYENDLEPYNSVRVYDGYREVYKGGEKMQTTVTLSGLDIPSGELQAHDATMGMLVWEGDANLQGDYLKINGVEYGDALNAPGNVWNGSISKNGKAVSAKTPDYKNNMGVDIDLFPVGRGYGIAAGDSKMTLEFGTGSDKYFPGVVTLAVRMKNPLVTLQKTVADENHNQLADEGEILTYTFKGSNVGAGSAALVEIVDTLPSGIQMVPNSLEVIQSPGEGVGIQSGEAGDDLAEAVLDGRYWIVRFRLGKGANAKRGGVLAPGERYEVRFRARVNPTSAGNAVSSILNIAHVSCVSDAMQPFSSAAWALLNPQAGPLPVSIRHFSAVAKGNQVLLSWITSMEYQNKHFIVEKSVDGKTFIAVDSVAGKGTTSLESAYTYAHVAYDETVYFRLKQVDLDGRFTFSKIIAVNIQKEEAALSVYPNPFISQIYMEVHWPVSEQATLLVTDGAGHTVHTLRPQMRHGVNRLDIRVPGHLARGVYGLVLLSGNKRVTARVRK